MATHCSTLAWKIPWTEDPGRLQSMGQQRVGYDSDHDVIILCLCFYISLEFFCFCHETQIPYSGLQDLSCSGRGII